MKEFLKKSWSALLIPVIWLLAVLFLAAIYCIMNDNLSYHVALSKLVESSFPILTAIVAAALAFDNSRREKKATEEKKRKVYKAEFEDLVRHLKRNTELLIQLVEVLGNAKKDERPSPVHFKNLQIPNNSILLSNDPVLAIDNNDFNNQVRIRVNIRNINNSARVLENYASSSRYSKDKMIEMLQWEISRYFGYIARFTYYHEDSALKDGTKSFPSTETFNEYIHEKKSLFYKLFLEKYRTNPQEVREQTEKYIDTCVRDRSSQRRIILYEPNESWLKIK